MVFLDCKIVRIFGYSSMREPRSNKRSGTRLCETRVLRARETLRLFLRYLETILSKNEQNDCFAVSLPFFFQGIYKDQLVGYLLKLLERAVWNQEIYKV